MALVVRPSPIHSVGVYTSTPIRKGARVVEYDGERITPEEADRRYDGVSRTYLYGLEDGRTVIDGRWSRSIGDACGSAIPSVGCFAGSPTKR